MHSLLLVLPTFQETTMRKLLNEVASRCPGGRFPDNYLVCDSETSNADPTSGRVQQFGFCVVTDRKVHSSFAVIINHGPTLKIHPRALAVHGIDHARMVREGVPPAEGLKRIFDTFATYKQNRLMFVGHNLINFDVPFFERESRLAGNPFVFEPNEVIDTGMLVKAAQLGMYFNQTDTLRSFAKRVSGVHASGVYWALDRYCYDVFGLGTRSGIRKDQAHDAGIDSLLCHHLLEGLRDKATTS